MGVTTPFVGRDGAIAQLGERLNGIQEVGGSIPPGSTSLRTDLAVSGPIVERQIRHAPCVPSFMPSDVFGRW